MSSQKGHKKTKLEERILSELNSFLRTRVSDKRLMLMSFTKVELNNDLSMAKVFWDSYNSSEADIRRELQETLDQARGKLRAHLAQVLNIRHTPDLTFGYDSQFESEKEIESILADEFKKGRKF